MSIAPRLRDALTKIRHRPVDSRNNKRNNRIWLITAFSSSVGVGFRLGSILARDWATDDELLSLVVMTVIAAVSFVVLWFALREGSRVLVKNCTFTNNSTGLSLTTGEDGR